MDTKRDPYGSVMHRCATCTRYVYPDDMFSFDPDECDACADRRARAAFREWINRPLIEPDAQLEAMLDAADERRKRRQERA